MYLHLFWPQYILTELCSFGNLYSASSIVKLSTVFKDIFFLQKYTNVCIVHFASTNTRLLAESSLQGEKLKYNCHGNLSSIHRSQSQAMFTGTPASGALPLMTMKALMRPQYNRKWREYVE